MKRAELEALSAEQLRHLIADAAAVLAARCPAAAGGSPPASGALFTFGSSSQGGSASSAGGLFSPPSRAADQAGVANGGGLFGLLGQSGTGGSAGGLFASTASGGGLFAGTLASATAGTSGAQAAGGLFASLGQPPATSSAAPFTFGVSGLGAASGAAAAQCDAEGDDDDDVHVLGEEVTIVNGWTPSVSLEILDSVETGEEGEEQLYSQRSKLYRFKDEEWKERGLGEARLLKDKATGRVRFLLRQDKTGKVAANFYVVDHHPYCDLRPNAENDKIWVWSAQDFADGELSVERFALRFGSSELAEAFKEAFEDAKCQNKEALSAETKK